MPEVEPSPAVLRANGAVELLTMSAHTRVATTEATGLVPLKGAVGMTRPVIFTLIRPSLRTRTVLGPLTQGAPPGLTRAITGLAGAGMLPTRSARRMLCPL